ncbi:MAG TPA: hypothetical protein VHY35_06445 [Stellaceae bacterium]|jgi:hypothetical protein|nr:hypothetical protein [Stellaceae bacterium]
MKAKTKTVKAWAVTNLGGTNLVWHAYGPLRNMGLPIFLDKKNAVREKMRLDAEKPSPNSELFERRVIRCTINYEIKKR